MRRKKLLRYLAIAFTTMITFSITTPTLNTHANIIIDSLNNDNKTNAAIITAITDTTVTFNIVEGHEYSIDNGKSWTKTGVFTNLKPNTQYTIVSRCYTNEYLAYTPFVTKTSNINSDINLVPKTPTVINITSNTIQILPVSGVIYSIDGVNWNYNGVFNGLTPNTLYTVFAKYIGSNYYSSTKLITSSVNNSILLARIIKIDTINDLKNAITSLPLSDKTGTLYNNGIGQPVGMEQEQYYNYLRTLLSNIDMIVESYQKFSGNTNVITISDIKKVETLYRDINSILYQNTVQLLDMKKCVRSKSTDFYFKDISKFDPTLVITDSTTDTNIESFIANRFSNVTYKSYYTAHINTKDSNILYNNADLTLKENGQNVFVIQNVNGVYEIKKLDNNRTVNLRLNTKYCVLKGNLNEIASDNGYFDISEEIGDTIEIEKITITSKYDYLPIGDKMTLGIVFTPKVNNEDVVWESSNNRYATITENGVLRAKEAGRGKKVTITAETFNGKIAKKEFYIGTPIKKIVLKCNKTVKVGNKLIVKSYINSSATNKKVVYKVSNSKYASINPRGVLTPKKAGKGKQVTVTVISTDGFGINAKCKIKIK